MEFPFLRHFKPVWSSFRSFSTWEIYTDGSSKGGMGSWAYVISRRGKFITEKSGRVRHANSNSMEFQAAIEALSIPKRGSWIRLYSDSRILVDSMKFGKFPVAHQSQYEALLGLSQKHHVQWEWVKAHHGVPWNERCDQLCISARSPSSSDQSLGK